MASLLHSKPGSRSLFIDVLAGRRIEGPPPIWLMRQAGRYLPEYRETRAEAGSFLDLCYNPKLATEVTLQPIRRYGFDAAILFSDILVVPHALGQKVAFVEGEGPQLEPIGNAGALGKLSRNGFLAHLGPVFEAVERIRASLPESCALIGFCGAPWTVATYMVGGRGSPDQFDTRMLAYRDPELFQTLIDLLADVSVEYLSAQVAAGADALQVFDTWGGNLPARSFDRWVIEPTRRIVAELRARHPDIPIIGFARGAGTRLRRYVEQTGIQATGIDWSMPIGDGRALVPADIVTQGNLDPLVLVSGGAQLDRAIDDILEATSGTRHVFNLGHGIVPQTPPEHVAQLVQRVRGAS